MGRIKKKWMDYVKNYMCKKEVYTYTDRYKWKENTCCADPK